MTWYKKISPYTLSGFLLGVGFVFTFLWPLGILGAALLLHSLLARNDSWKVKLLGSYLTMFIKFLFVLAFYWTMYPITWLPFDFGYFELVIIGLYWVSVASYLSFGGFVLYGLLIISKKVIIPEWIYHFIFVPVAWVFSEIFGSLALSIFTLGPGSAPNINFSLGYIGYLLGEHQLLAHLARLGGVYALSFTSILAAVIILHFWQRWHKKEGMIACVLVLICILSTNISLPAQTIDAETKTIALISTYIPVEKLFVREDAEIYRTVQEEIMKVVLEENPDYVIWPEDARYFSHLAGNLGANMFSFTNADKDVVILDSGVVETEKGRVLRAEIVDVRNKSNYIADKRYLVPQGEFMPYLYQGLFHAIGLGEMATKVAGAVSYVIGPEVDQSDFSASIPSVLFCFESADANGVRSLMRERADVPFIAHPVSHVWFHEPNSFWSQLDTSLRVQAIWNQVYIASSGNHAPSKLFTPLGGVVLPKEIERSDYWKVGLVSVPIK